MEMALSASHSEVLPAPVAALLQEAQARPAERNPALVYLAGLAPSSAGTMRKRLARLAELLTAGQLPDPVALPWERLRYQHTAALRARLSELYAPATANLHLAALRGVLRECWRLGLMSAEDLARATDLKSVRGDRLPRGRGLSAGELRTLFEACAADPGPTGGRAARDAAMLSIMYVAGPRRSELVGLQLEDYNGADGTLKIRGKGNRERLAYITDGATDALEDWLACRGLEAGPLFYPVNKTGRIARRSMTDQAVYEWSQRLLKRAGVKRFSPHDLRRTFISDLFDVSGGDMSAVKALAGHVKADTTLRYDRRGEVAKRKAASRLHVPYIRPARLPLSENV